MEKYSSPYAIQFTEKECELLLKKIYRMQSLASAAYELILEPHGRQYLPGSDRDSIIASMVEISNEILETMSGEIDHRRSLARRDVAAA